MANDLLYPKDTETRRRVSLDGLWKFAFDEEDKGDEENWQNGLNQAEWMPVPTSFNDLFTDKGKREYTGTVWYERELIVPTEWKEKDLDIRFGSVTHHAEVYVNGQKAGEHQGGYTPFNVPVQELLLFDEKNTLVVKVSNELNDTTLPSGTTSKNMLGKKMTATTTDFFNYSGIQRSVHLVATPKESIMDISLEYKVDAAVQKAEVFYDVETTGSNPVFVEVYDEDQQFVAKGEGKNGSLVLENVRLWQPGDAYLYTFKWSIRSENQLVDSYMDEAGIREVTVNGRELLINGTPVYLKGYVRHEYSALRGAGSSLAVLKRDFELMKWSGANAFRTAQFPHDEEVYRMADREGFIVINEVPAIGMASPKPNRFAPNLGKGLLPYFERENVRSETFRHHQQVIRELIKRDKNHASVCVWSLMEEPDTVSPDFTAYVEKLMVSAKELDSQNRPFTIIFNSSSLKENPELGELTDIVIVNEYAGWEEFGGYELSDAEDELASMIDSWAAMDKPIVVAGYGSEALQGEMKLPSVQWSENYQNEVFDMQHRLFDACPSIQGELVWSFTDYQKPEGLTAIDGTNSGVFTANRQPKTAAFLLKNRWTQWCAEKSNELEQYKIATETI